MRHDEYLALDATALAQPVARREVAAADLLALAQLERVQPQVNAVVRSLEAQARAQLDRPLQGVLAGPPLRHGVGDPPPAQVLLLTLLDRSGLLGLASRAGLLDGAVQDIARDSLSAVPFSQLANVTGVPAMSVPLYWTPEGLPLGVQFVAPFGDEATLLQLATELESAQPWFDRLAPLARASG